jgi:hypothetical protein
MRFPLFLDDMQRNIPEQRRYSYHSHGKDIRADSNIYIKPKYIRPIIVVAAAATGCVHSTYRNNEAEF